MKITISVTQDDINCGGIGGADCPIWIAGQRVLPAGTYLWVAKTNVSFDPEQYGEGDPAVVELPRVATEFIELHDNYRDGKPFEFELDVQKSRAAVFYAISLGLAALAFLFHAATPRKRPAARHAAPDDGQDWADVLRSISSPLRARKVPAALAVRGCRQEMCKYWPGDGCMRGVMPCDDDQDPSHADLDQYLTEDAKRYPAAFDAAHRILDGEIAPPWIGPQVGDITLDAPMTYRPEPPLVPLPPARIVPDVPAPLGWEEFQEIKQRFLAEGTASLHAQNELHIAGEKLAKLLAAPEDVPGPAETASPPPPSGNGAEAALPPAVASAGPGTTRPDVDDLDNTGVMAALTDWALHAPLDQVRAVSR